MAILGDYLEDVPFDHRAAEALAEELAHTASMLTGQAARRLQIAAAARESFHGEHALQFDDRARISSRDAENFASALTSAANGLRVLAEYAAMEQQRRLAVREGVARYEATVAEYAAVGQICPYTLDYFVPSTPPIEPPALPAFEYTPTPRAV